MSLEELGTLHAFRAPMRVLGTVRQRLSISGIAVDASKLPSSYL